MMASQGLLGEEFEVERPGADSDGSSYEESSEDDFEDDEDDLESAEDDDESADMGETTEDHDTTPLSEALATTSCSESPSDPSSATLTTTTTATSLRAGEWRVADGNGILCAKVAHALSLARPSRALVKVSYVEPGAPGANVLFRSKQVIHETAATAQTTSDPAWDSCFEYEIFRPASGDWRDLEGDLLFTLYEDQLGQRRVFLGQALVPLIHLLDFELAENAPPRVHGGTQRVGSELFALVDREGAAARGKLALELRLELPPDEPVGPSYAGRAQDVYDAGEGSADDDGEDASRESKSAALHAQRAPRRAVHPAVAREQHLHRVRERQRRQIDLENRQMQARIRRAKSTMKSQPGTRRPRAQQGSLGESKATEAWRKTLPAHSARTAEDSARADELSALTREAGVLRQRIVGLKDEISHAKSSIARDETLLRRERILAQEMDRAHHESKSREAVRKVRARNQVQAAAPAREDYLGANSSGPTAQDLRKLRYRVTRALEAQSALSEEATALLARRAEAQRSARENAEAAREAQTRLERAIRDEEDRVAEAHNEPSLHEGEVDDESARELRVRLAVLKERADIDRGTAAHEAALLEDDIRRLRAKLERKVAKAAQAQRDLDRVQANMAESEARRRQDCSAVDAEAATLRAAIAQLRHAARAEARQGRS